MLKSIYQYCLCLAMTTALLVCSTSFAGTDNQISTESLYQRLGGVYAIATVVDDFIERALVNDVLNANPAINAARTRVPKAGLKFRATAMMCQVAGGPEQYTGRTMKDAHAHLNITEKEWQAMLSDFKASLAKYNVGQQEQTELLAIVDGTKKDIVVMQ